MIPEEIRALNVGSESDADKEDLIRAGVESAQQRSGYPQSASDDTIEDIAEESRAKEAEGESRVMLRAPATKQQHQQSEEQSGGN